VNSENSRRPAGHHPLTSQILLTTLIVKRAHVDHCGEVKKTCLIS
jgi:hypothetical protein